MFFETIKCDNGNVFYLNYHQKRIINTIGLNINLSEYIYPPTRKLLKCKVIYNDNGILDVNYALYIPKDIKIFKFIFDNNIVYDKKTLQRDNINKLYNQKDIADEIIIVKNNLITDTSIANIAIFDGSNWITPKNPLLNGTTRDRLIDENKIIQKDITIKQFRKAKQIALLNAMIEFKIINNPSYVN
jgi:4-amino-4-deoxychorismate lyase